MTDGEIFEATAALSETKDRQELYEVMTDSTCAAVLRCEAADCYVEKSEGKESPIELANQFERLSEHAADEDVRRWFYMIHRHFRPSEADSTTPQEQPEVPRVKGAVQTRGAARPPSGPVRARGARSPEPQVTAARPALATLWLASLGD